MPGGSFSNNLNPFEEKAASIPFHGRGLSVDLHVPDLYDLVHALNKASLPFDYLEIFRGPFCHLEAARDFFKNGLPLEYHADGLWFTQPRLDETPWQKECDKILRDTECLKSAWITHECASKEINGYFFGTYLPPLLTEESARLIGSQTTRIQNYLSGGPLLLIEVPPFYTFCAGELSLAQFFKTIADSTPCGILLDVGHVYTYYLSTDWRKMISVEEFFQNFLDEFPLERVVQIHVGGLRPFHQTFLDDHGAKTPEILFEFLEETLKNSRLTQLRGIALEVDTKEIELIVEEYETFLSLGSEWLGTCKT
jgi:hypothetical protein